MASTMSCTRFAPVETRTSTYPLSIRSATIPPIPAGTMAPARPRKVVAFPSRNIASVILHAFARDPPLKAPDASSSLASSPAVMPGRILTCFTASPSMHSPLSRLFPCPLLSVPNSPCKGHREMTPRRRGYLVPSRRDSSRSLLHLSLCGPLTAPPALVPLPVTRGGHSHPAGRAEGGSHHQILRGLDEPDLLQVQRTPLEASTGLHLVARYEGPHHVPEPLGRFVGHAPQGQPPVTDGNRDMSPPSRRRPSRYDSLDPVRVPLGQSPDYALFEVAIGSLIREIHLLHTRGLGPDKCPGEGDREGASAPDPEEDRVRRVGGTDHDIVLPVHRVPGGRRGGGIGEEEGSPVDVPRGSLEVRLSVDKQLPGGVGKGARDGRRGPDEPPASLPSPVHRPGLLENLDGLPAFAEGTEGLLIKSGRRLRLRYRDPRLGPLGGKVCHLIDAPAGHPEGNLGIPPNLEGDGGVPPRLPGYVRVEPDEPCLMESETLGKEPPDEHGPQVRGAHPPGGVRVIDADPHARYFIITPCNMAS